MLLLLMVQAEVPAAEVVHPPEQEAQKVRRQIKGTMEVMLQITMAAAAEEVEQ